MEMFVTYRTDTFGTARTLNEIEKQRNQKLKFSLCWCVAYQILDRETNGDVRETRETDTFCASSALD